MAKKQQNNDDNGYEMTVSLELDDGSSLECGVLSIYTATNKKQYIAVQPVEFGKDPEGDVYIYGYGKNADGEPELINITDDEEFDIAIDSFEENLDLADFFDLVPADDADDVPLQ